MDEEKSEEEEELEEEELAIYHLYAAIAVPRWGGRLGQWGGIDQTTINQSCLCRCTCPQRQQRCKQKVGCMTKTMTAKRGARIGTMIWLTGCGGGSNTVKTYNCTCV